jgi:hypothetical protein
MAEGIDTIRNKEFKRPLRAELFFEGEATTDEEFRAKAKKFIYSLMNKRKATNGCRLVDVKWMNEPLQGS